MILTKAPGKINVRYYEFGRHIKSDHLSLNSGWNADLCTLFLPLQLHDEEENFEKRMNVDTKFIEPFGGDVFMHRHSDYRFDIFLMDVAGHGFYAHGIAKQIIKHVKRMGHEDDIIGKMSSEIHGLIEKSKAKMIYDYKDKIEEAEKAGFEVPKSDDFLNYLETFSNVPMVTASSISVDLQHGTIAMVNMGNPPTFLIELDSSGNMLEFYAHNSNGPPMGTFEAPIKKDVRMINKDTSTMRIIVLSDSVNEQKINIPQGRLDHPLNREYEELRELHDKDILGKKQAYFEISTTLQNVVKTTVGRSPEEVCKYFEKALKRHNNSVTSDDITFGVLDLKRR